MSDIDPIERSIIRLADRLDGDAENRNYHDFVGTHRSDQVGDHRFDCIHTSMDVGNYPAFCHMLVIFSYPGWLPRPSIF